MNGTISEYSPLVCVLDEDYNFPFMKITRNGYNVGNVRPNNYDISFDCNYEWDEVLLSLNKSVSLKELEIIQECWDSFHSQS